MTEAQRIADQLRRAMDGHAWHGPSLREVLDGITAKQAAAKPLAAAHSIWEITLHIGVWGSVPRRRMHGESLTKITPAEDWPAVTDTTDAAWQRDRDRVMNELRAFADEIATLNDARIAQQVPQEGGEMQSTWFMLHGAVQHVIYHAGQIALLKKAGMSGK